MNEVLKASNSSFGQIVKSTVFIKDMNDFGVVNEVYGRVSSSFISLSPLFCFMICFLISLTNLLSIEQK